ncbi:hypothetical protein AAS23_gp58 [Pantoea phage vB_PagS_AAS23]|uniref:Uncharacterized protein n=1 Tax=Pantoea phage vB_PagS_AAS23 TaxID=2499073 RepID=A0A3S9U7S2_9CAUD|nr:hypothetical protein HOU93_gp58 [Pantoea phage vB_PagS_AAS23]AZS06371.1 hypothetical protein AAS23_gp58 [Pantoea phage vB_PagS_AAS23]
MHSRQKIPDESSSQEHVLRDRLYTTTL